MPAASSAPATSNLTDRQTAIVHPTYQVLKPEWDKLRDVREGVGGFMTGDYLVGHPREYVVTSRKRTVTNADGSTTQVVDQIITKKPTRKFEARRNLASYENVAATIIDSLKSALCREQPTRRLGDGSTQGESDIEKWWDDVDGIGTHIDDFIEMAWDIAATFGHVYLYMDRQAVPVTTETATAADQSMPFLRIYTPLDVWDWRVNDLGQLVSVKFAEIEPQPPITDMWIPKLRIRIVDETSWKLYDQKGTIIDQGEHKMGTLPVVALFAVRRPLEPQIGKSVLGDPKLFIDLYNLNSELRELLRNQTFGILNVPLGTGDAAMTLTEAQAMMGTAIGTENVLFSGLAAQYISPAADNVQVYHDEISRKLREIYRLAGLPWEADRRDAEAEGSMKLKREEMNQRLATFADECEKADYALACLFYRATYGADTGEQRLEDDELHIKYPDNFDTTPFDDVLKQAQAAQSLGMPALFLKMQRKMLARKFDGFADLPQGQMEEIDQAIEATPDDPTPAEQARQRMDVTMQALKSGGKPPAAAPPKGAAIPPKGAAA
jgi:hypothetical protein